MFFIPYFFVVKKLAMQSEHDLREKKGDMNRMKDKALKEKEH